jgi:ppGpp synthetase/RelA/SpoT-type nucleotidyltranferase
MPEFEEIEHQGKLFFDQYLTQFEKLILKLKDRLLFILYDPLTKQPRGNVSLLDEGYVRARVKERSKYLEKIKRKYLEYTQRGEEFNFKKITDYIGARVIHYERSEQEKIKTFIRDSGLEIFEEVTHEVPSQQFGYQALHIIIKIPNQWKQDVDLPEEEDFYAEIQISTVSMHLWSNLSHKVGYKDIRLTEVEMRELYKLAALCEIVDDIYDRLIQRGHNHDH